MNNLQQLYNEFLATKPSNGKIKTATTMLIHVCKALDLATQEEVIADFFDDIPRALDNYFDTYPLKATQDKAILAEMIGRVGPRVSMRGLLDCLLSDKDENVRQYTLHSLEYFGKKEPASVFPYIERFRKSTDPTMVTMAAHLTAKITCSDKYNTILEKLDEWFDNGDSQFVLDVLRRMVHYRKQGSCKDHALTIEKIENWSSKKFDKASIY